MPAAVTPSALAVLPENYKALLYVLALSFPGQSKTALVRQLRDMGARATAARAFDAVALNEILEPLQRLEWLSHSGGAGQPICLLPGRRNLVLQQLSSDASKSQWLEILRGSLVAPRTAWDAPTKEFQLQSLWLAMLQGQAFDLQQCLNRLEDWEVEAPAQQLLADEAGKQVFASLFPAVQCLLLEDYLQLLNCNLQQADEPYRLGLMLLARNPEHGDLALQLLQQALWRGDWQQFAALGNSALAVMQQFIAGVLAGSYAPALTVLHEWTASIKRQSKKRKLDLPPVINGFYCLALLASGDPQRYPTLKQAVNLGVKERYGRGYPALLLLVEQLLGSSKGLAQDFDGFVAFNGFDGLLLALALYWADAEVVRRPAWRLQLEAFAGQLSADGYHWLAAEVEALLAQQFGHSWQPPTWYSAKGLQPLVGIYQRQEAWQHALTALALLNPNKATATAVKSSTSRIAWLINASTYATHIEPREQKLSAKGQW
ncbi:MAG: ATP-dependent helicase, partial [Pseudomonadaceae bacterium]|nr:ATP-dependent helicase [Pseudomonadaceae bacterium]